jgi:GTP-binding protein Era
MGAHRAGFAALVGPPNVGKSTLLNRLVSEKMAIVSPRPQTTRTRITGICSRPDAQVVFVDTPGLSPGGGMLGELMRRVSERALEDVDLVCWVADASERPWGILADLAAGPLGRLGASAPPVICCLNKVDLVEPKARLLPVIAAYGAAYPFREIVPVSAALGTNCDRLLDLIAAALPEQPPLFPADVLTDQPETLFVAEAIREKIFRLTHEEVPYACAVRVEELTERTAPPCLYIRASIFVEQPSQKGILIGRGGSMLKRIGTTARRDLERFFGVKVYLELRVEVRRAWRKNAAALREFGFHRTS